MACSWDADLVERMARATAVEVSATGLHWTFSPVLCIARDLRWGRVGETFGEDPFLIGELGAAMVRGYQGPGLDDPTAVLACAKHFAGYSETQGGRDASEADISPRKLRSWFLPPFERVARAGCRTFMLGYQAMDGVPITANRWLLNDVLKGEWGFTGMLVTDWDDVGRMVWEQKVCADHVEAAAVAVRAGNDLVMTTPQFFDGAQDAVAQGLLAEAEIDDAVRRILRLKFELGPVRGPASAADPARRAEVIGSAEHAALNLEVARRSLVLLRNDGTLPLEGGLTAGADGRALGSARHARSRSSGPTPTIPRRCSVTGPATPARSTGCPTATPARWCRPSSTASAQSSPTAGTSRTPAAPTSRSSCPTRPGDAWHDGSRAAAGLLASPDRPGAAGRGRGRRGGCRLRGRRRRRHDRPDRRDPLDRHPRAAGRPGRPPRRARRPPARP